jgi:small subunit ribosomal protein S8
MVNFTMGDLLVRIKNSSLVSKDVISVPKFKYGLAVLEVLKNSGYIKDYEIVGNNVDVFLKYDNKGVPAIQNVKLFSTPGRRWYVRADELTPVRSGMGIMIVSTPKGVMTTTEAKKQNSGGELICEVW